MTPATVLAGPLSPDDVAERLGAIAETFARPDAGGVCVVDGFGARLVVERGALEVHDGIGEHRRTRRYDKATHGLARVVVANADGVVSLAALRWCHGLGIAVYVLGPDGSCHLASTPRTTDDARLRRAQALAPLSRLGLDLARLLLSAKVKGQAALVAQRFSEETEAAGVLLDFAEVIGCASSVEEARQFEATAAALYFAAWSGRAETSPVFVARDRARVPAHWQTFETRRSVLASGSANRKAERPTNALLNYTFALLESEAVLACAAVGLDPGLGVVHADSRARASFALDLIEPVRPEAEGYVLDLLASRSFRKAEFTETGDGHVRVMAPLTHALAEALPRWRKALAPWAEKVAHLIGASLEGRYSPVTPLTGQRTRTAAAEVKVRRAQRETLRAVATSSTKRQRPTDTAPPLPLGCVECGGVLTNPRHVRCADCLDKDPAQAPEVRSRRGKAIASRKRALAEASTAGLPPACDGAWYRSAILPRLAGHKLVAIMDATGYSKGHASTIRRGTWTPHPSTWAALAALVGAELPGGSSGVSHPTPSLDPEEVRR